MMEVGDASSDTANRSDSGNDAAVNDSGTGTPDTLGVDGAAGDSAVGGDSGGRDAGPPPGTRSVFMLSGHLGRRMLTCDAGDSWVFDVSQDDDARCWDMAGGSGPECDHHGWSNSGVAFGEGRFIATAGWGEDPGTHGLYAYDGTSRDVAGWERVFAGTMNQVAYGNGAWVGGSGAPAVSVDGGETFSRFDAFHYDTPRGAMFADVFGGRHVVFGDVDSILVSDDAGASFFEPDSITGICGTFAAGGGNSMILYNHETDAGCRSVDGGLNWTAFAFGGDVDSRAVWTGTEYWAWGWDGAGTRFSSPDGETWRQDDLRTSGVSFAQVARAGDGTLLAVRQDWGRFYEDARIWRSTDGLMWENPAGSDQANGHPIRGIAAGHLPASACD